jgi:hypothetical protein
MNVLTGYLIACATFGAIYIIHGLRENQRRPR